MSTSGFSSSCASGCARVAITADTTPDRPSDAQASSAGVAPAHAAAARAKGS